MEKIFKLTVISLIVLELLAIFTHLDILVAYIGESIMAFLPVLITLLGLVYLVKALFK